MGIMVYSLVWVVQDLDHQPYFLGLGFRGLGFIGLLRIAFYRLSGDLWWQAAIHLAKLL